MTGTKEIKDRIASVRETRKITNAMYLIASTKLRKAKVELANTRPYFDALHNELSCVVRSAADLESPYISPADEEAPREGTHGCLVITADKGLAGSYNMNVVKQAQELLHSHPDTKFFVVGDYGRQFFQRHGIPIEQSFLYTAQNPTLARAREICARLLDGFLSGELREVQVIYTDIKSSLYSEAKTQRLLPLKRSYFAAEEAEPAELLEISPSPQAVLKHVMPSCIIGFIYSALIDSFCSEQNARMNAMDSANKNAEKLLDELSLQYNRVRQARITQEITEISAGAKAQKHNRRKEG